MRVWFRWRRATRWAGGRQGGGDSEVWKCVCATAQEGALQIAARAAGLAAIVIVVTTAVDGDCPTDEVAAPGSSVTEPPIEPPRRTD